MLLPLLKGASALNKYINIWRSYMLIVDQLWDPNIVIVPTFKLVALLPNLIGDFDISDLATLL
jgi:hypothetical protein